MTSAARTTNGKFFPWGQKRANPAISSLALPAKNQSNLKKSTRTQSGVDLRVQTADNWSDKLRIKNGVWGKVYKMGDINAKRENYKKLHKSRPSELMKASNTRLSAAMNTQTVLSELNTLLKKPKASLHDVKSIRNDHNIAPYDLV